MISIYLCIYFFTLEIFVGKKGEATGSYSEMMLRVPQVLRKMSVFKGKEREREQFCLDQEGEEG